MSSIKLMPAETGTNALGIVSIDSWLTSERGCYVSPLAGATAPNHVQFAGVTAADGTDAARKRGRPPRGEPR